MLIIFKAPQAFSFGLEDRLNGKMARWLTRCGVPCVVKDIWSDFWAKTLFFSRLPYLYRFYRQGVAPFNCWLHLHQIQSCDVVWVGGTSLPIFDTSCWFEKKVIERGASLIYWMEDDWFSDPAMKESAEKRMELAHLVVAVTPTLLERIRDLYPNNSVILLEEAIDVERLAPRQLHARTAEPLVIAGGRPWSLEKLSMIDGVLKRVYQDIPFKLRIITGAERPNLNISIPWEWLPYDRREEAEHAAGAVAGLAPLENTVFNSCKGNYKVKTYMAMGIPPLTSSVGYNRQLIQHGETGFLLQSSMEWEEALRMLLKNPSMAQRIGTAARDAMTQRYSYEALMPVWAQALQRVFPSKLKS